MLEYAARKKAELLRQTPYVMDFITRLYYLEKGPVAEELNFSFTGRVSSAYGDFFGRVDCGKFKDGIDPMEICSMMIWMVDGYIHDCQRTGQSLDIDKMMENFYKWERRFKQIAYKDEFLE